MVEVASACGLAPQIHLKDVASFSGVVTQEAAEDDEEEIASLLAAAADEAAAQMLSMQEKEGAALAVDLNSRLDLIEQRLQVIREAAPLVVADQKARLEQRLADLLGAVPLDENRLANEVAVFADRWTSPKNSPGSPAISARSGSPWRPASLPAASSTSSSRKCCARPTPSVPSPAPFPSTISLSRSKAN